MAVVVKQENWYLEGERKLNSQELEKFKWKLGKIYGFFQQKSLCPERTKRKKIGKGIWSNYFKQGLSRRTGDEEQVGGNREQVEK